ncbi:SCO family protein [Bradyrhizobium icense]|nr:SCO family protein [Bradyrhizobium icense]
MEAEMQIPLVLTLAVALATVASAVSAHSLKELEGMLGDREKYFQAVDKAAPEFTLQDAEGRTTSLADFRGKVVVLNFIYASCPDICPLHADRIAEIQGLINQSPMKTQVQFISITTDPSKDTSDVLRHYGQAHRLDSANWLFLTTRSDQSEDATRNLAERFGHRFDKTPGGYQIHSIVTHVIDSQGRWRASFHGLKFEPTNLVVFVNALVNDAEKPHGHIAPGVWEKIKRLFGS